MPTVTSRWRHLPGDFTAMCSVCGVCWHRSRMVRDSMNRLLCPDDVRGLNEQVLDRGNADGATRQRQRSREVAGFDADDGSVTPPQRLTIDDVESGV